MAPRRTNLRERFDARTGRVDEARGIIYRVRVLGPRSRNGRHYPLSTIKGAARLYEGCVVRKDHPDDPDAQRATDDTIGWLRNARVEGDSLFADLHYLKSHPFNRRLVEAARRNPNAFGLSHNADGNVDEDGPEAIVREITEVRSVDVVDGPATTTGLFEQVRRNRRKKARKGTMKLREFFDRARLHKLERKEIRRLMEGGYMDPDLEMPAPVAEQDEPPPTDDLPSPDVEGAATPPGPSLDPASMDPEAALLAGFNAAWSAVFTDNTLDQKAKIARAKELIKAYDGLAASGQEIPEETEEEAPEPKAEDEEETVTEQTEDEDLLEDCDVDGMDEKKVKEAFKRQQARERARRQCREAGVEPTSALLEALVALPSASRREELLEEVKPRYRAESAGGKRKREERDEDASPAGHLDTESFARRLLGPN